MARFLLVGQWVEDDMPIDQVADRLKDLKADDRKAYAFVYSAGDPAGDEMYGLLGDKLKEDGR